MPRWLILSILHARRRGIIELLGLRRIELFQDPVLLLGACLVLLLDIDKTEIQVSSGVIVLQTNRGPKLINGGRQPMQLVIRES